MSPLTFIDGIIIGVLLASVYRNLGAIVRQELAERAQRRAAASLQETKQ